MENLILHNKFHNGDIFYSRTLLNILKNKYKIDYYINPNLKGPLLCDVPNVTEHFKLIDDDVINYANSNGIPIVETWIGTENYIYLNAVNSGCTYENHFTLAKTIANRLGVDLFEDPETYLPTVDYQLIPNYNLIEKKINTYKNNFEKIILISNGDVHSGQSYNFDFTEIIKKLSINNKNILFLTCQDISTDYENILCTSNITEIIPDLLQISYISTYCSAVVGRASGPFCFAHTKDNLTDVNKTFISFGNNVNECIFYNRQKSKSIWSNNYDFQNVLDMIQNNI